MPRNAAAVAAAVAAAAVLSVPAAAGEGDPEPPAAPAPALREETVLAPVVVTPSPWDVPFLRSPASLTRIDLEELQRERSRRTLADGLLDVPSVMVQKTAYGQASPFVRGFTGYHTVLLVDGIRLNNSTFRTGPNQYWSTIDMHSVEAAQAARGPGAVLYGSDAVGGTLNAVARRRTSFEEGSHGSLRTVFRGATAERSHRERLEAEGNVDGFGFVAGATSADYGDLRAGAGSGRLPGTGYRERAGDVRLDFLGDAGTVWTLGMQHVRQWNVPRTEQTVDSVPFHGTSAGTELKRDLDQERDLLYGRVAVTNGSGAWADDVEVTASWHRQAEEQDRDRTGGRTDVSGYTVHTVGLQAKARKRTGIGSLTAGAEWWRDSVSSYRRDYLDDALVLAHVQGPVADDAGYDLLGVFVEDEIPLGGGVLVPGARFTHAAARGDRVDDPTVAGNDPATPGNVIDLDDSWNNVVGSLRTVQPLGRDWTFFGGVSQAFRAPNLSDLTRLDDTSGVETPTLGLDPEEFLSAEAGTRVVRSGWTLQAALWRTWIDGLIVASPTGALIGTTPEVRKDNVGDGWVHGIDAEASVVLAGPWSLSGAATWMRGEVDQLAPSGTEVRAPASRLMPPTVALTLACAPPSSAWSGWTSFRAAAEQDELSLKDATDTRRIPPGGTPGYGVLSAGVGWAIREGARIGVVLENVFNKDYRIHGSGVNEPGRNLVVTLDFSF